MEITHRIKMDLAKPGTTPRIPIVQGDTYTRKLSISLYSDRRPWIIPSNAVLIIQYRKPDRSSGTYDTLADGTSAVHYAGNNVNILIAPEALCLAGIVSLMVTICLGEQRISTFAILLDVAPDCITDCTDQQRSAWIAAFLPSPENATPGQHFMVDTVDETGHVLSVKTMDLATWLDYYLSEHSIIDNISISHKWDGTVLTITSVSGTSSADLKGEPGVDGKSAYAYALEGGYTGTEADFSKQLASKEIAVTPTIPKDDNVTIWINPDEEAPAYVQTINGIVPDVNGNVVVESGGMQSDWNAKEGEAGHVLNRTHWADVTFVEFLSECNPTYNADQNAYVAMATAVPAVGDTYTIRWNGVDYVCVAQDASVVMPGAVGFGNGDNFGLASNGEPFAVLFVNQDGMVLAMVMPFDGSEEITLAAYKHEENVHKLDNKYIDSEWMATIVDGRGTPALEEQALTFSVSDDSMTYTWNRASAEVMPSVEDGKTYIIVVDGVEYTATAKLNADSSDNAVRLTVGTSIDFWAYTNGVISMIHLVGYGTNPVHVVGIYEKAKVPNKLPAKFLPDNQSGSADWNASEYEAGHIRNRTHYDEIVKLLPLSVFSVKDPELGYVEEFIYDYEPVLVDGETYTVTWNGVEYSCVASLWEEQDGTIPVDESSCITLGDRTISGDAEPFLIGYFPSLKLLYLTDLLAVETISASITKPNFKKLDNKFLDMTWFPNEPYQNKTVGNGRAKTAQHPTYGAFCIQKTFAELVAFPEMVDVTFDSTKYSNLKFTYIEGLGHLAGNLAMMNSLMGTSFEDTGEPFLLQLNMSNYALFTQDTAATFHTHTVLAKNIATPNKMPEKFMPESVSGIIIRSSTEDSTKKFKLTVDDSGTVTATEV